MVKLSTVIVCLQFLRKTFIFLRRCWRRLSHGSAAARARSPTTSSQRLQAGDTAADTVIVTGSARRVSAVAARYGLTVRKRLKTGAVLDVPAGALEALSRDGEVDQVSGNHRLRSQMAVTNAAIGADQAWEGIGGLPGVTGQGIGVAIVDSGIAEVAGAARPRGRERGLHRSARARDRRYGHGTHVAGIVAAAGSAPRRDDRRGAGRASRQPEGARRAGRGDRGRRDRRRSTGRSIIAVATGSG